MWTGDFASTTVVGREREMGGGGGRERGREGEGGVAREKVWTERKVREEGGGARERERWRVQCLNKISEYSYRLGMGVDVLIGLKTETIDVSGGGGGGGAVQFIVLKTIQCSASGV